MDSKKVPSYKAIAIAILKNDTPLISLGFSGKSTPIYGVLKRIQLEKEGRIAAPVRKRTKWNVQIR
jgi:predicted phosphoadenosine phosphosulfate sulfurtransferase